MQPVRPLVALIAVLLRLASAHAEFSAHAEDVWRTHRVPESGPPEVVIEYRPHTEAELARLVGLVERGREKFHTLAETTFAVTIHVVAAPSEREFARLTEGMIPDWGAAVAVPEERLIVVALNAPDKPLEESVVHEVSHVLLGSLAAHPVPRWFDEGVAMYLSGEWNIYDSFRLARGALGRGLIPLSHIDNVLTFQQDYAWLAYAESFGAVSWLAKRFGHAALGEVMRGLSRMPFDEALAAATGMESETFEQTWLKQTRHRYALVGLADDVWLWSLLIPGLFFLALVVRWWRNRKTLRRWKEEDDDDGPDEPLDERIADTY